VVEDKAHNLASVINAALGVPAVKLVACSGPDRYLIYR
jgi:hypothetical protein